MPNPVLATSEDLRNYLGIQEIDRARADFILGGVTTEVIKASGGQSFDKIDTDMVTLDGSGHSVLMLPLIPVHDVLAVTEAGVELEESAYEWSHTGILRKLNSYWLQRFRNVTVQYRYGYEEVPEDVRLLIVRVSARGFVNPTGLVQENVGSTGAGYGFDASRIPQLTESDREVLRPYSAR